MMDRSFGIVQGILCNIKINLKNLTIINKDLKTQVRNKIS
jgi:hypothetical protein